MRKTLGLALPLSLSLMLVAGWAHAAPQAKKEVAPAAPVTTANMTQVGS